jgi:molecular chaperone HscB
MANAESKSSSSSSMIIPGQGPRRGNSELLVVRHHARGAFLQFVRQSAAAGSSRLLHLLRISPQAQPGHAALEKEFYALSRRLHPDLFAQANPEERAFSLEQSSMLNDAYRTLKDPIKRTEYLLRLEGVELEEQSKQATEKARATGELKKQVVPPDLLEEVFELNMHLEELRTQKKMGEDDPALLEEIGKAKLSLEEKYDALFSELKTEWNKWDKSVDDPGRKKPTGERFSARCWMC